MSITKTKALQKAGIWATVGTLLSAGTIVSTQPANAQDTAKKAAKASAKTTVAGAKATAEVAKGTVKGVTGIGKDKDVKKDDKKLKK